MPGVFDRLRHPSRSRYPDFNPGACQGFFVHNAMPTSTSLLLRPAPGRSFLFSRSPAMRIRHKVIGSRTGSILR